MDIETTFTSSSVNEGYIGRENFLQQILFQEDLPLDIRDTYNLSCMNRPRITNIYKILFCLSFP